MTISNETGHRSALITIVAVAIGVGGCTLSPRPDVSSFLIRRGKPSVSFDAVDPGKQATAKSRNPASPVDRSPRELSVPGVTVETTDKLLAEALARLRNADTAANRLLVAAEYKRLRIFDEAYDQLTMALKIDSKCAEALEQRAQIWRDWGLASRGLSDAYRAVFVAPRSPSAANTLGTLLQSVGQKEAARRAYQHVLELDPHAAYAWSNLCYVSLLAGDHDRAVSECQAAVAQDSGLRSAQNNLAMSYAASNRVEDARHTLAASGNSADAEFNIGILYLSLGRYAEAEQSFRIASELRPNFTVAQTRRLQAARLAEMTGKVQ